MPKITAVLSMWGLSQKFEGLIGKLGKGNALKLKLRSSLELQRTLESFKSFSRDSKLARKL
jgi:hypothetical protein